MPGTARSSVGWIPFCRFVPAKLVSDKDFLGKKSLIYTLPVFNSDDGFSLASFSLRVHD
jgi:hypothetical protein